MNTRFVIFGNKWDLALYSFADIIGLPNVTYIKDARDLLSTFVYKIFHFHCSGRLYQIVNIPFKRIWSPILLRDINIEGEGTVFIFFTRWIGLNKEIGMIDYIRRKNPSAKFVWFLQDIYSHNKENDPINALDEAQSLFDLIISFDPGDCEKYGFVYHPLVMSQFRGETGNLPPTDIYFLGRAKNRLDDILLSYRILREKGLKCDFHITDVPESKKIKADDIFYEPLSYLENLQHIKSTKCLLELMQQGGVGYTQRGCEAVVMDKMLLTNNQDIKNAPFYNGNFIKIINNPNDIDEEVIESIRQANGKNDYKYKEKLSPIEFLEFIEKKLLYSRL